MSKKKIKIGRAFIDAVPITLYLDVNPEGSGSSFHMQLGLSEPPSEAVVLFDPVWQRTLSYFFHELTEISMSLHGLRFRRVDTWAESDQDFIFHFDHREFSEVMREVANACNLLLGPLQVAWTAHSKQLAKEKKRSR